MTIRSAFLPGSKLPYRWPSNRALAPLMVAICKMAWEGTTVGSSRQPLWMREVSHISSTISMRLLEEAPSVPMLTQIPSRSIRGILAKPNTRMAEAGLWETFTSRLRKSSTSSLVSHTVCTASRF